jgi:hypothetical protein
MNKVNYVCNVSKFPGAQTVDDWEFTSHCLGTLD